MDRRDAVLATAARTAGFVLVGAVLFFAVQLAFAFQLQRPVLIKAAFAGAIAFAGAARALGSTTARINAALIILPCVVTLLAYESYAAYRRPRDGTAAWLAGRPFDSRSLWETLERERDNDPHVVSYIIPRTLLTHNVILEHWQPEALARSVKDDWGIVAGGVRTLPLGGISNRRTVFGNESGTRNIYESDEHGFNNPRGIWTSTGVQVAILGDSFSHGAGVDAESTTAAHIRKRFPRTLNLGMCANGPLMEYAGLKEYIADVRPPIVLWMYYLNDLSDMEVEKTSSLLMRYLEDDGFRQGLAARQAEIDEALETYLDNFERGMPRRWPAVLAQVGLSRETAPLWLEDLITREQHSSLTGFIRLDASIWLLNKLLLEPDYLGQAPDYELFAHILEKARDTVASWHGRLHFVYLPAVHHLERRHREIPSRGPVLELVERLGIPVIDVHRVFLDQPDPERFRFHYESHANEAGYALHAETILGAIQPSVSPAVADRAGSPP
jgi:hypothetical protein